LLGKREKTGFPETDFDASCMAFVNAIFRNRIRLSSLFENGTGTEHKKCSICVWRPESMGAAVWNVTYAFDTLSRKHRALSGLRLWQKRTANFQICSQSALSLKRYWRLPHSHIFETSLRERMRDSGYSSPANNQAITRGYKVIGTLARFASTIPTVPGFT
jgi:hypothetical protein